MKRHKKAVQQLHKQQQAQYEKENYHILARYVSSDPHSGFEPLLSCGQIKQETDKTNVKSKF